MSSNWNVVPFTEAVDICDTLRKPINSSERASRIKGKEQSELYPYYGATGQVGFIDDYITDGEYVLLGEDGAPFLDAFSKKAYIISGKTWVNNHAHVLKSKTNNKFLCYYLNSFNYKGYVSGTTRLKLTQAEMKRIPVPVPPLSEQERIVARIEELFSQLDAGVETLKKTKAQLAVYRQAVLETAFRECASKENVQFGDILSEKPRNGYSPKGVDYQTKYRNLTLTATTSGYFRDNCFKYVDIDIDDDSYLWVKHNDILIQRANTIEYVGTSVLYQGEDNRYVYPDLMMKCHTKDGINPQFVVYQLQSRVCKTHFREHATGTSGSMPKINQQTVMTAPIVMTSLDEQERIVKQIGERLSVCDNIEKTVDTALQQTEAMRQSILKQAFEGRM